MIRLGNNEVLKTLTKTLTFVDANTEGSTIALRECCSGELKVVPLQKGGKTILNFSLESVSIPLKT